MTPSTAFSERSFFLTSLQQQVVVLVLLDSLEPSAWQQLDASMQRLQQSGVRLLLLAAEPLCAEPGALGCIELGRKVEGEPWLGYAAWPTLQKLWQGVLSRVVGVLDQQPLREMQQVTDFLSPLRPNRVLLLRRDGGIKDPQGGWINFISLAQLAEISCQPPVSQQPVLSAIGQLLQKGVRSVSLCKPENLERELLTYEGAGTYFSIDHYCRVERLRLDHFSEVESMIHRGEKEGFLMRRPQHHLYTLLSEGWGAFVGGSSRLAGVVGVLTEPYAETFAGEIISIYTLTRYKGNGVGARLLQTVAEHAADKSLHYLFAATQSERVAEFFLRSGYREVELHELPPAKWQGYDPARKATAFALRLDLTSAG
ncbi:GCN5-related N-acetyltransferase [Magnetococcus marinus MC-1]|uniref:Amino-acid acetyltransferase n=1 Tax=Magnetococcus marinus (strain ATCC BAA-1437 / JCM 17883 / MC-1) TaxID=156889 RepID=A0LBT2_MAGMM|nr:GNAT family N-acetyltransferase [Magnetococcus marinus]ABK45425.1 GCN5-related N-acetyltransferase [Magnetococcus marinus MC-1]